MTRLCPTTKRQHQRAVEAIRARLHDAYDTDDTALQSELEDELGRRVELLEELCAGPERSDAA